MKSKNETAEGGAIRLRIIYDGAVPSSWDGGPKDFGLQDKSGELHLGKTDAKGNLTFDLSLTVKPEATESPVFLGAFAHGPPKGRFLYLSWRRASGAGFAQRLKLPLGGIGWADVRASVKTGKPITADLRIEARASKPGGTNFGGTRGVTWKAPGG